MLRRGISYREVAKELEEERRVVLHICVLTYIMDNEGWEYAYGALIGEYFY